jgi:capsular polysaccharide biosynthesis protein
MGYHHWLTEVAVKLVMFNNELHTGKILVPANSPAYMRDFFDLFGIDNIESFTGNVFARELRVVTNPNSGHFDTDQMCALRNEVVSKLGIKAKTKLSKIYLSRKNARARKVVNEKDVVEYLKGQGFDCIELENESFRNQVEIFSNCHTFISVHGAGLSNAIFMPPGGQVIEFYGKFRKPSTQLNACYHRLARALEHEHHYIFCERVKEGTIQDFGIDVDVYVDIEELDRVLNPQPPI